MKLNMTIFIRIDDKIKRRKSRKLQNQNPQETEQLACSKLLYFATELEPLPTPIAG